MVADRSVLVVDDEPLVVESCRRILSDEGYQVESSGNGRDGLGRALSRDYDVVLTDLKMPDIDGMDLIRRLKRKRPGQVVIVITGYGSVPSAVEAVRLGVSDYIEKPFSPDEIKGAVEKALESSSGETAMIEADSVRSVLRRASRDPSFGASLLFEGSRVLTGFALSPEAKAAIASGDVAWIEKQCGELTPEEREWLERRLSAEVW